eukprot:550644-Pyramimonas_sp.AAC.2
MFNIQTGIGWGWSTVEGVSPTNLVGYGRLVLPAAQRWALCPVDHPYRGPLSSRNFPPKFAVFRKKTKHRESAPCTAGRRGSGGGWRRQVSPRGAVWRAGGRTPTPSRCSRIPSGDRECRGITTVGALKCRPSFRLHLKAENRRVRGSEDSKGQRGVEQRVFRGEVSVKCSEPREPQNQTKSEEYQKHLQGVVYST